MQFVKSRSDQPERIMLTVPLTPTDDNPSTGIVVCTDPPPKKPLVEDITALAGFSEVTRRATRLADATDALIPTLKRHKKPAKHAAALTKGLRERTGRPTLRDHKTTCDLERQIRAIEQEIDRGVLTAEEDNRERIAYWRDKLRGIRTREGLERLAACVKKIVSCPRKPDLELALLNNFAAESQHEFMLVSMEPIRRATGADTLSLCRRWQDLRAFGSRFFVRHIDKKPGISFRDLVRARESYKAAGNSPQPIELEWADRMREVTESLHPLATAAGFTASERTPIMMMIRDLGKVLEGTTIDFDSVAEPVQVLVAEITTQASRSRHSIINRFHRLVIDLQDDVTRTLKFIDKRTASADLTFLDHYVINGKSDEQEQGPGGMHDIEWRTLATSLTSNLNEALGFWKQETGSPPRSLKHDFVLVGKSQAKLGIFHENSFHALVLRVARIFITPEAEGAVPQTVLDDIGPGPNGKPCHGVARLHFVRDMHESKWPAETAPELEREHVAALDLCHDSSDKATGDQLPVPESHQTTESRFISKGLDQWEVSFQGGPEFILKGKGASYLHHLIRHDRKSINATKLQAMFAGQDEALFLGNAGEASDDVARKDYEQQCQAIQSEIEKAAKDNDEATVTRLAAEQRELLAHIKGDQGLSGRTRLAHDNKERARKAVRAAIDRTITKIREFDRELADHLQQPTLQLGATLTYSPTPAIRWVL